MRKITKGVQLVSVWSCWLAWDLCVGVGCPAMFGWSGGAAGFALGLWGFWYAAALSYDVVKG